MVFSGQAVGSAVHYVSCCLYCHGPDRSLPESESDSTEVS